MQSWLNQYFHRQGKILKGHGSNKARNGKSINQISENVTTQTLSFIVQYSW